MKKLPILLLILYLLNFLDYGITLLNRGNFEEANPLTRPIIDNTLALTLLKLVLVPLCVYVLWRYKDKPIVKIASVVLCLVYLYAVTLGVLIYASN
ncbi:MAG TPA: hypothetical protein GX708_23625 [Gallicola sp.]|nr:hypothetical protein [Gallicola sp.]